MRLHNLRFRLLLFLIQYSLSVGYSFAGDCNVKGVESDAPVLCGYAEQGGLLYGETDWVVGDGGNYKDGIFAIGLPMDQPENLMLPFCKAERCELFTYKIKQRKYKEQHIKVDSKFVLYPPEIQKRIDRENEAIIAARGAIDASFAEFINFRYPFSKRYRVSGVYGSRRVFNGLPKSPHKGLDIAAPKGAPVRPIGRGRVVLTMNAYLPGKSIVLDHGYGIYSVYIHLDKINVKKGDVVGFDSVIGRVGNTGRSSGPHLHLGLYAGQTPLDPELLF